MVPVAHATVFCVEMFRFQFSTLSMIASVVAVIAALESRDGEVYTILHGSRFLPLENDDLQSTLNVRGTLTLHLV